VRDQFLDTDRLRQLHYGNLVLRRSAHLFLGSGVLVATSLLLLFWLVTSHWDLIATGKGFSGKATAGESYAVVTTMIALAPPPRSVSESISASPATFHKSSFTPGKIVKVRQEDAGTDETAATKSEFKQAIQNHEANDVGGAGSGTGGDYSGVDGLGDDGAIFGTCEKMPAFLEQKKPTYPEQARLAGIRGKVFVKVLIGADGHPVKAMIMKRLPAECLAFDTVALKSVIESIYSPAIQNGRAVKVWCIIPVGFQLYEY
jgi:periplasmic protein TonB